MEKGSTGTGADQRCDGTTWKASPARMYSMMRATISSKRARVMLGSKRGTSRATSAIAGLGTGPARRRRTSSIVSAAAA